MSLPTVAILILHTGGGRHLEHLLPSLAALDYPRDRLQVVVVDNGSDADVIAWVSANHAWVRVLRHGRNLGFAAGYNEAIRQVEAEWVALLNDDTRVDPDWVHALLATAARQHAACIAALMVDWDGQTIDYAGGIASLVGHAWQRHHGERLDAVSLEESPTIFACGGAMLIRRDVFLAVGAFDPSYFIYFEDVDLGWRLALAGHRTVLSPAARTYHRVHGTMGQRPFATRLRLYERNALVTIYKCLDDASLARVLPVATSLTLARGLRYSELPRDNFALGRPSPDTVPLSPATVATLLALEEFATSLPALTKARAAVQASRVVADDAIFALLGAPLHLHQFEPQYLATGETLIEMFGLRELVAGGAATIAKARRREGAKDDQPDATRANLTQPDATRPDPTEPVPAVSVIVLTMLGARHLPDCLGSLSAQTYPRERLEVIVVDNDSPENPAEAIAALYPGAQHLRMPTNVGFCAGNNAGVRAATGEYVLILNDDVRLAPDCVAQLMDTARRRGAWSVGARILSWDGERIDFAGGGMNFYGKGFQTDVGATAAGRHLTEEPTLFGCGAAVLFDRARFLEAGGFNERFHIYYEDLALGWQMWLRGGEVWYAPGATVYHRHHGTTGEWPKPVVVRLYERNALTAVVEQFELTTLSRVLPAAIALAAERALIYAGLSAMPDESRIPRASWPRRLWWRCQWRALSRRAKVALALRGASARAGVTGSLRTLGIGGLAGAAWEVLAFVAHDDGQARLDRRWAYFLERGARPAALDARPEEVSGQAAALLTGLDEFLAALPRSRAQRAAIGEARRRSDDEIFGRFRTHWLSSAVTTLQGDYEAVEAALVDAFGVDT